MSRRFFDIIIVGAGIMGASTARELSRRGRRVLLIDQFAPPHDRGSSHGETRVIREAYFEDPAYVPMVQRAYELWGELEKSTGQSLLQITGGLMIGPEDGAVFRGARQSAEEHGLRHELLSATQVQQRFPALRMPGRCSAVYEPRAGMLFAERSHQAMLTDARGCGTEFRWNATVTRWEANDSSARVFVDGDAYEATQLVLAGGAWLRQLDESLSGVLSVERQVLHWFDSGESRGICAPGTFPVHVWEYEPDRYFYALPDAGSGVKAALHHQGQSTTAEDVAREVTDEEKNDMRALIREYLPALDRAPHHSAVCLYTNTPDGHFIVDRHPVHANVLLLSPCSGHGFKFAPAIGEMAADLCMVGRPRFDIPIFRFNRF